MVERGVGNPHKQKANHLRNSVWSLCTTPSKTREGGIFRIRKEPLKKKGETGTMKNKDVRNRGKGGGS